MKKWSMKTTSWIFFKTSKECSTRPNTNWSYKWPNLALENNFDDILLARDFNV